MSRLCLYLLGPPRIEQDGEPVRVDTRKAIALLAYLAITGESHRRDALVNLLWPEYDHSRGRTNLRRTLYALRKALADDWLEVDREAIRLNPDVDPAKSSAKHPKHGEQTGRELWLDVDQFHRHIAECLTHAHPPAEGCLACLTPLTTAVALYRGDFLSGFSLKDSLNFDDWQSMQSGNLRRECESALERLVQINSAQGTFDTALQHARRWLALDPLNEAAHRHLMRLYVWLGQRTVALRQYQECQKVLEDQLGIPPQAPTTALYQSIADGRAPRPPLGLDLQPPFGKELDGPCVRATVEVIRPPLIPGRMGDGPPVGQVREPSEALKINFVAREEELARLCYHFETALAGQAQIVFVIGGPGRGKTALIQEFARRAQERWAELVYAGGNCNAHTGFGDPYLPFRETLGLLTGDVDALWTAGTISREHARRLWDVFPLVAKALVEMGPDLIDSFVPGPALMRRAKAYAAGGISGRVEWLTQLETLVARKAAIPHDPNLQQSALFEQYARVMMALARERPLLLAVDDLQWADLGSIGLLFHLGRRLMGERVLILGAYRPEEIAMGQPALLRQAQDALLQQAQDAARPQAPDAARYGGWERHPLEPVIHEFQRSFGDILVNLAQAEDRRFVAEYLDSEPNRLSAIFRETLYAQTKGHPLFTVELLRGMQDRGDLIRDDEGRWVEGQTLDWETLPNRVEAVIEERVGRLDYTSREALRVASVEGETFTAEVVAQVRSADEKKMVECLSGELERRHRLIRAQEMQRLGARRLSRYRFRHILFQNYLYHDLDPVERAHLHEAVGTALERLYGEEAEEIAVPLARHFQEAGIAEKAALYLFQAGEKAKRSSANEAAIAHLTRGLELLQSVPDTPERARRELDLRVALGIPLVLTRGHAAAEVERTYARAAELSAQLGDDPQRFHALMGLRRYYLHRAQLGTAHQLGEQLLALDQLLQDPSLATRAHMMHAETLLRIGGFKPARDHFEQGIALYDPQQHRSHAFLYGNDTGVIGQVFQGVVLWQLGYPDQALQMSLAGLSRAEELSHPFTLVCARYFTAVLHYLRREPRAAQELVESMLGICQDRSFALYSAWGAVLRGRILVEQGAIEEGLESIRQGLDAWRAMGAELLLPHFLGFLAEAHAKAGQAERGLTLLSEALALVDKNGERCWEAELYRLKGELTLVNSEDETTAEECFQHALEVARRQSARSWELRATMSLSRLWQKQGKREKAWKSLQGIYGWFGEGFDSPDLVEAGALLEAMEGRKTGFDAPENVTLDKNGTNVL